MTTKTVSAIDKYGTERTYTNLIREWFKVSGPSADDTFIGTDREGNRENINRYDVTPVSHPAITRVLG